MQMMQRTIANKPAAAAVRRAPLLPARPRSVIVRFKEDDRRAESKQPGQAPWVNIHQQNPEETNENPIPVSPMQTQSDVRDVLTKARSGVEYDAGEPKVSPWSAAFTRRREIFAGRLAMVGFAAACFWEYILPQHPNITQQIGFGLQLGGLNNATAATGTTFLVLLVLHNAITSLAPWSATFSEENQRDVSKRPAGPPTRLPANPENPGAYLGVAELGAFSKANELFTGRVAMLGFAAAVIGQFQMGGLLGPGPVAQIANYLNTSPDNLYLATPVFFAIWPLFWTVLSYARGKFADTDKEKEQF